MEIHDFLIIALTSAIAGIAIDYCIQAIVNNDRDMLGFNQDKQTFGTSVGTSCLAIISDALFYSDYSNRKYSAIVAIVLVIVWIIQLIVYIMREDHHSVDAVVVEIKVSGKYNRNRDIARGVIFLVLSSSTILMHILGDSFAY